MVFLEGSSIKYEQSLSLGRGKPHFYGLWNLPTLQIHIVTVKIISTYCFSYFGRNKKSNTCLLYFGRGDAYALRMYLTDMTVSQLQVEQKRLAGFSVKSP